MRKMARKLMTLVLAGIMVVGMGVTAMAAEDSRGDYSTKFTGNAAMAAMAAMADNVFDGADMSYDEDTDMTTVTVYTKLYTRPYNGGTAKGWISSLELTYVETEEGEVVEKQTRTLTGGAYEMTEVTLAEGVETVEYPTQFSAQFSGDITGDSVAFDTSASIYANGYSHNNQTGVLTLSLSAVEE